MGRFLSTREPRVSPSGPPGTDGYDKPRAEECQCCGRKLRLTQEVWLELDQRDDTYHNFGDVPDDKSQGAFVFGPGCARKKLAEAKSMRAGR